MAAIKLKLRPKNPKGGPRGLSEAQVAEALRKNAGNVTAAAQALGVTDSAIKQRIRNHPELAAIREDAKLTVTDMATHNVIKRIQRDDWPATQLWLRTQAGWSPRTELTGKDGAALPAPQVSVLVEYVDAPKRLEADDSVGDVV